MRFVFLLTFGLFNYACSYAQVSLQAINLNPGRYVAGFRHYLIHDSSRTYKRAGDWNNISQPRPIPVSVWYPSGNVTHKTPGTVMDYLRILKEEEEWEHLPDEKILDWFSYSNTPENKLHLKESTRAFNRTSPATGKFPLIVYAPSFQASSIENFALCEYLASYGYVVISSPSRGTENKFMGAGTEKDMETQARDIEFLISEGSQYPQVDQNKIATMGFSFGGLSHVLSQMRNAKIKAIVSLDGSIKYQYATLKKSPFVSIGKVDVPFLHMAQKDIPAKVLAEDKIDSALNYRFEFYDELLHSTAFSLKFHNLTHSYFSTLGVLFQSRDRRQDKTNMEIMESYRWMAVYALNFLEAYIKEDKKAMAFLENDPAMNGIPHGIISKRQKPAKAKKLTFEDFNNLALNKSYMGLDVLCDSLLIADPQFKFEEGKLNNLGLQLLFNRNTSSHGIAVLNLATRLYPQSANLFDSLGEAYLFTGQKALARKAFKTSLDLDKQNQNAIQRLSELDK